MDIAFRNLWFSYGRLGAGGSANTDFQLRDLNFEIGAREFVALAGRSGSGKTTLLQMFNGLLRPQKGQVLVDGRDLHRPGFDLTALRRRVGLAFQFPEAQLFAATVREDVGFAPAQQKLPRPETEARVKHALALAGLREDFLPRNPLALSEGEKRRVALAGILAMQPEMLVLDEPTASLDAKGVAEVTELLRNSHQSGRTIVMISHDTDLIANLVQRILVLDQGSLLFDGTPAELWGHVDHEGARTGNAELCVRAGLPLPRSFRLRQQLLSRGWQIDKVEGLARHDNPSTQGTR